MMVYVRVRVVDANTRAAVQGCLVRLDGATAVTDADGVALMDVPPGRRRIAVSRSGYRMVEAFVEIAGSSDVTVELIPVFRLL
ncbi:MAG: hypothetical protein QXT14_02705 [Candidatus Bathyarchaeia archaeon]